MNRARRKSARPLFVVLYAALIGLLLASYVAPLQEIFEYKMAIPALEEKIEETEEQNVYRQRLVEDLQTPEGIERAARERYGMIRPGEKVYLVPE